MKFTIIIFKLKDRFYNLLRNQIQDLLEELYKNQMAYFNFYFFSIKQFLFHILMSQYSSRNTNQMQNLPQSQINRPNNQIGSFQNDAIRQTYLKWSSLGDGRQDVVIKGESDVALLKNLRNILLGLQTQFTEGGAKVIFTGQKKDDFNKRLILLESQIQGLLKRKIQYSARDQTGGTRVLDYTGLLNEKQTQIVELQKKINNLEQRLRRTSARQLQLQNHIANLYAQLKKKEQIILAKNEVIMAEVATSNALRQAVNRLRKNLENNRSKIGDLERAIFDGVNFPDYGSFEIKADILTKQGAGSRNKGFQNLPQNQKSKAQLIQLFREFQRFNNQQGISDADIQRTMEGFLVGFNGSRIKQSVDLSITRRKMQDDYLRLKDQFGVAVGIFQTMIEKLKKDNPSLRLEIDPRVFQILRDHKISVFKTAGDIVHLERFSQRTIQVPVQDARTKHLIHLLAIQMKKFCSKYPKLMDQMDVRLTEFFQQQLIDVIQVDEVDRLVQIVKYVPQVVKVENVYAYSSQKSRRIQFHLRVLVKALLQQLQKLRRKTGAVLEIDQGIIGMINQQIMGVVDVDDILKVFRVVPKIVEVQKIVQKIVDRIVQVPQIVSVEKIIQKIVEVQKIRQVERIVNVPLEVPTIVPNIVQKVVPIERIVQRIVEVPHIVERIIQVIKQVPKVQIVQRIVQKPVQVQRVVEVQKIVNHIQTKIEQVQVVVQKIIHVQKIIQVIRQVPVIVEKIVDRVVQMPKVIEVQKLVEIVVPVIEYKNAKEIQNHIEIRHNVVDRIIQKPVPIIQTVQRILQVPQIVQKIVTVQRVVQQIVQVQRIVEKIAIQDRIQQVVKEVKIPVEVIRQVIKQVEKIVQIPIIHERIVTVQQIIQKPVIQKIQNTIIKQVYLRDPIIIKQPKTIQVEKIVNHYIDVPKPIKYIQEKIVQVIKHVDRIKQIKVPVEKVIQKMVEVPKVVQVQKIVQKVVVVPRVVQKVVQVPQIVQRVVPKIIIEERVKQVQKIVQVPMIQDKIVQVEVPKNVYIQVEKIVERIVDKLVEVPKYQERVVTNQVIVQKVIEVIKQIPRNIQVQKIVHVTIQSPKVIQVQRQIIVPVQVPVPMQKIVQKIVPITQIIQKVVQVPQVVQKIVSIKQELVQVRQIPRMEEKIVNNIQYKQIVKQVPYITQKIKQVQKVVQKIVPVQSIVQQIVTAQQIIEKVVEKTNTIPRVYQVERIQQKVVQIPKIVQIQKIIPQIVNVNRYIQNIVQKIVQVPVIVQRIKEVIKQSQKIVQVRNQYETIKQVQSIVQKAVVVQKFKQVVRNINHIQKVLQIVDRFEQTPVEILVQQQKLVEVPYILQKIVEKIVVMPQIVQVLKYVHEITEKEELGVAVGVDVATHQQRLKILSKDIKVNFDLLLTQLRKLLKSSPNLRIQIQLIERFLMQLQQFILYPKIFQIPRQKIVQKIVEKDRIVSLPTQDQRSIKMELTLSLLVQKLIIQLKRLRRENPNLNLQLEDDVKLIFFTELQQGTNLVNAQFNAKLKSFADSVYRKFESLGNWSIDHQMMLNSFLQERFLMANLVKNANLQIQKSKSISLRGGESSKRLQSQIGVLQGFIGKLRASMNGAGLSIQQQSVFGNIFKQFDTYITTRVIGEPVRMLGDLAITDGRIQSMMRQKDAEILRLRDRIFSIQKSKVSAGSSDSANKIIQVLRSENLKLKNSLSQLQTQLGSVELIAGYKTEINSLQARNLQLEQMISNLTTDLSNYKKEHEVGIRIYESNVKDSAITGLDRTSQASSYQMNSPESGIRMVESSYKNTGDSNVRGSDYSGIKGTDSRLSTGRQQASYGSRTDQKDLNRATYQTDDKTSIPSDSRYSSSSLGGASVSGTRYGSGSGLGTGVTNMQAQGSIGGTGAGYGSSQLGSSGLNQSGSSSYGQSGIGQSGNYQGATYGSSLSGSGSGSGSTNLRPGSYQGSTGMSSTLGGATGTTGATGMSGNTGATGYSSSTYKYGQGGQGPQGR